MTDSDRSASHGTQLLLTFEGRRVRETTLPFRGSAHCWVLTALDVPRKSTALQLAFRYLSKKRILPRLDRQFLDSRASIPWGVHRRLGMQFVGSLEYVYVH